MKASDAESECVLSNRCFMRHQAIIWFILPDINLLHMYSRCKRKQGCEDNEIMSHDTSNIRNPTSIAGGKELCDNVI
jgi:hypothetical protein